MRYQFTSIGKRWDGNRVYSTTYYPVIPPDVNDIYITASEEDYLDSLAKKYYGSESFWWVIANANGLGNGKLSIPLGKQIRIPGNLPQVIEDLKTVN